MKRERPELELDAARERFPALHGRASLKHFVIHVQVSAAGAVFPPFTGGPH